MFRAWSCLGNLSATGHRQEDGSQSHRTKRDLLSTGESSVDGGRSLCFLELAFDKADYGTGGLDLAPGTGKSCRQGALSVQRDFDLAKTSRKGRQILGEAQPTLFEVADVAGKAFDFGEIMRRNE